MKDLLETVLKLHEEKRAVGKIISVTKTSAVPPGENHMSQVSRLEVETESPSGKRTTRWMIWKELPEKPVIRAYITQVGHFKRELICYRDVLTVYEDLLEETGYSHEIPWPKCICLVPYSRIVIDDLKPLGYKMGNKFEGLNLDHCVLALQSLGFFHALSILANERQLLPLEAFSGVHIFGSQRAATEFQAALNKLVPVLKSWGGEWNLAANKIHALIPEAGEKLKTILATDENRLNVLNHGDCWTNNFLFKYDLYSGKPLKVSFFDFQLAFYHTPAHDVNYFLALTPDFSVRGNHVDHLIKVYHESLTLNMDKLQVAAPRPSLTDIRDEVNRLGLFKLFLVLILAPKTVGRDSESEPFNFEEYLKNLLEADGGNGPDDVSWLDFESDGFRAILEPTLKEAMENDFWQ